jgi:hypothetical protein
VAEKKKKGKRFLVIITGSAACGAEGYSPDGIFSPDLRAALR